MTTAETLAGALLRAGAVHLRPEDPFTFASGLRSPIYCDNRLLIGDVAARRAVIPAFAAACAGAEIVA
ncbi:MAG TPA: orotate phosphoribosyltransferase, partial [Kouleothrix sp.]|nr:orotate phosphoribosyltransferase [Kouleothrix sp.]